MSDESRGRRVRVGALALATLAAGCGGASGPERILDEEGHLERQIADLRVLVARAEKGSLVGTSGLVVAIHETLVKKIAALALPRERVVAKRFRVRLEKANVWFRDGSSSMRLDGRVSLSGEDAPQVFAELAVFARLDAVRADLATGRLETRVVPIGLELQKAGLGGESAAGRAIAEGLARSQSQALSDLQLRLTIPVGLERHVRFGGVESGPVRIRPASFPLRVAVREVTAHGRRLWVVLKVDAGPWEHEAAAGAPAQPAVSAKGSGP
jgi:hypothetical protein